MREVAAPGEFADRNLQKRKMPYATKLEGMTDVG
jgi:hypothetical protein